MIQRRTFLLTASATTLSMTSSHAALATSRLPALAMADISVRKSLEADYPATLEKLKSMGFTHFCFRLERYRPTEPVEPSPVEKARMVNEAGLKVGVVRFADARDIDRYIEETQAAGAGILALTLGDIFRPGARAALTLADVDDFAARLDGWGEKARRAGITFAYHNHAYEGTPVEGIKPLERIFERTDPQHVAAELDLAWAGAGGFDVLALLEQLGPRVVSMHWKDVRRSGKTSQEQVAELGAGDLDLRRTLPQVTAITSALPVIEIEYSANEMTSAEQAAEFIKETFGSIG